MHGYSSSSETDDEYTRRRRRKTAVPVAPAPADANKKKKKPKLPPQQSINRIWKRFSNKRFSRALAVLPFDPVLPPTISDRSNELLQAGYERAAEECRRKVRKIIQECRRVNMRYRDPGFDLDWDLKYERGYCLNSLDKTRFDLSMSTLLNPSSIVPKAVKRVHEIFEKPTFMKNLSGSDVKQGGLGDCWLVASFSGLANVEDGLKRICVEYDTRIGIYGFVFYRDGEWIYSIIDDKLYLKSPCWDSPSMQRDLLQQIDREDVERVYRKTYQTGSKALFFAQCKDQNETWVPLMEKAYAKAHGDYGSLTGGWIGEGLEDLTGGVTTELLASDILDLDGFWETELSRVNEEFLFGCSTGLLDGGYGDRNGISEGHAYVVMEARTLKNGTRLVKLRNPWGKTKKGIWEGAWSDGSKEWTTEAQEELGHQFGNDSVFWISYDDLIHKYQHFDRTRLFRDPDWRCCQRWIGVEVPWKAHFHEKFHIKLTKEGPLVLLLSQLDDRYFKGLDGQYSFRLHFRLHEQDRPDPEDYIVRSHGNYLMERSVSVELPSMLPGTYSVFISVVGTRHLGYPTLEDVVKRETKKRKENEKLAQVGSAYDLAHSKAAAHLDAVRKLRKKCDQKKASEARKTERKRLWEKRHLNREVTKQQARKNNIKVEAKIQELKQKEEEEKERKRLEEENKPKDKAVQTEEKESDSKADDKSNDKADSANSEEKPTETSEKAAETSDKPGETSEGSPKEEKPADSPEKDEKASEPVEESASVEAKDNNDESPDATPVPTPAETPALEKTEEQATTDGFATEMKETQPEEKTDGTESQDTKTEDKTDAAETKDTESEEKVSDKEETAESDDKTDKTETKDTKSEEKASDKIEEAENKTTEKELASASSSDTSGSPKYTPKTEDSTPADDKEEKVPVPPVDAKTVPGGPPPPPPPAKTSSTSSSASSSSISLSKPPKKPPTYYVTSEGESSASPIEEWEELYSSDDMTRKPRMAAPPPPAGAVASKYADETDDENDPDPWNAICVIGLRVYSKDENLELRVVMEGGELEEGGMGEKGGPDLDNAQANAGGARKKADEKTEDAAYEGDSEVDKKKKKKKNKTGSGSGSDDTEKEEDGMATYPTIVQKGEGESEYESAVETKDDKKENQ